MNVVKGSGSHFMRHFAHRHIDRFRPQLAVGHVPLARCALTAQGLHSSCCRGAQSVLEEVREGVAVVAQRADLLVVLRLCAHRRIEARHELGALYDQIDVAVDTKTLGVLDSIAIFFHSTPTR